jgi:hypothetical protein
MASRKGCVTVTQATTLLSGPLTGGERAPPIVTHVSGSSFVNLPGLGRLFKYLTLHLFEHTVDVLKIWNGKLLYRTYTTNNR